MSTVPKKLVDRIQFYEDHLTPFSSNAVAIGTSAAAVTDLTTKTNAARTAYDAQQAASATAKAATLTLNLAVSAMSTAGGAILKQVAAKAEMTGDSVYVLAQLPAPVTPSPVGPPGLPSDFAASLNPDGSLNLKWKCANPVGAQGTTYQVYRKVGTAAAFTFIGASGTRTFIDATLPTNLTAVTYQIVALRSTSTGPAAQFLVNFGRIPSTGEMMAEVAQAPRMAA
jgi:hypothetical protein